MDPSSQLDYALFQLTPTRTRCDLMIVAGGGLSERLASGLLEPFLSHLKSAKDQISKGGYSVTLRPPSAYAPWFTKATLQRFVRFVSTPEVLERFVTIEKEIVQIESSIQSSEKSNLVAEAEGNVSYADGHVKRSINSSKPKDELSRTNQDGCEENPRVRLQRVLDNRKAMLCKEQAMAYARALVAGFYPECVDGLLCFADAFGASRLREACLNFLELCKQKNEDKLWMDEIAAMQVSSQPELPYVRTSGIILAGEDDPSSKLNSLFDASNSDSTPSHASLDNGQDSSLPASSQTPATDGRAHQIPMSWPNRVPQYIHNFQGHAFQQMPPYQGYPHPGMQVPSSYYPGNMQWSPNGDRSHITLDHEIDSHKSSYKKKMKKQSQVVQHSEEDGSTASSASSDSSYESNSDNHSRQSKKNSSTEYRHKKKHGKKSSRKLVIRNINYITSKGDGGKGSSSEEEFTNGDSLKQHVEEAVASFERRNKSTSHHCKKRHSGKHLGVLNDSTDADSNGVKGNNNWDAFQNLLLRDDDSTSDKEKQPMKFQEEYIVNNKTRVVSNDSFVVTGRELDNEGRDHVEYFKNGENGPSFMNKKKSTNEELMFSQRNDESGSYSVSTLSGNGRESSRIKCQKEEDWFIVNQSDKPASEDRYQDFSTLNGVSVSANEKNNKDIMADDSFMIQGRSYQDQFNSPSVADISLVSDIVSGTDFTNKKTETLNSHEPDDLFMVLERDSAVEQTAAAPWNMEMDYENNISLKEANKKLSDIETDKDHNSNHEVAKAKTREVRNGKVSNNEAKSKALNASLGKSRSDITARSKASPGSRTTVTRSKSVKDEEIRKKKEELMIQRQKRIAERSASKKTGTETKTSLTSAKKGNPKIHPSNEDTKKPSKPPVLRNSTIDRLATSRVTQPKVSRSQAKPGPTKKPFLKSNGTPLQKTAASKEKKKQGPKEVKSSNPKEVAPKTKVKKVLSNTNSQVKNEIEASLVLPRKSDAVQAVEPNNNNHSLKDNGELPKASSEKHSRYLTSQREIMHESHDHALGENQSKGEQVSEKLSSLHDDLPSKPLIFTASNSKVNQKMGESNAISPKFSEIQTSNTTPPPSNQVMSESLHSRKKWISDEDSSKAAKGFRKLLFFGRRS